MKGIVAYDSVHGSTKAVAEAIAEQMREEGHEVLVMSVKEKGAGPLEGDVLFVGSPTRGGNMTKETRQFIESLDAAAWKGKRVVAFDTLGPLSKDAEKRRRQLEMIPGSSKNAALRIRELFQSRGLTVSDTWHFAVVGMWGPLAPDGAERARELTRRFLSGP